MLKASYDQARNTVIIEFIGKVDVVQTESFLKDIQAVVPKQGKGFRLLTDFTALEEMEDNVQAFIKKTMDYFDQQGVTQILRVIPTLDQDFGFNLLSLFHYSKKVKFLTLKSRAEADERLKIGA